MAADITVETGQPLAVPYTFIDSAGDPIDLTLATVRFWARALDGTTAVGGPATIVDAATGKVAYEGTAPAAAGELFSRFTATFADHTVTQPMPGGIVINVQDANPDRPIYAGISDLEMALGRPIPADERGYAMYLLAASTVAIDNYCCQTFTSPVPDPVRLACAGMAAASYGQGASAASGAGPIVQESIGDYSVRYSDPANAIQGAGSTPSVYGFEYMLKGYRLCGFGSVSTIADKTDPYVQNDGDYFDILAPESDL